MEFADFAYDGKRYIAVGSVDYAPLICISKDALTWEVIDIKHVVTGVPIDESAPKNWYWFTPFSGIGNVIFENNRFIATSSYQFFVSEDGENWTLTKELPMVHV
ncbi:MAG: hypothetical protein HPY90_12755 [Syntrophothermus sp.]|uniref:hypothetical protein n=1 Tax=Syntrophothermus sp. TaxID=2736299 RepID=UPI00257D53AA|nr:hypothetical protein [Syntrophothermus sp.]NSW84119.1 hypothetical protein [Syntrophothermus sp.]